MKALYIGSFDMFTVGHYEVLKQAEEIFDDILICIADNSTKERRYNKLCVAYAISQITKNKVICSKSLTTDLMIKNDIHYLIRGLRNTSDYLYEENLIKQYQILKPDIKVIYLRTNNNISSSFVFELHKRGKEIQPYLPYDKQYLWYPYLDTCKKMTAEKLQEKFER